MLGILNLINPIDKIHAQNLKSSTNDTIQSAFEPKFDSLNIVQDSVYRDGLESPVADTTESDKTESQYGGLVGKVHYFAVDSNRFDYFQQKLYLYKNAKIEYEDITLEADYIEIDFKNSIAFASGLADSTGTIQGNPIFSEGQSTYNAKEIRYNYDTKKGLIKGVFTKEGEGYLHGKTIKRFPDNSINIADGSYTTCDRPEHPHYEFRFSKSKVIPGNLIVTGPAYFVLEGLPTPLIIPFGIFPNKSGRSSGILIPTYGESTERGFFFENGGYYWAINDYLDLTILGDIYSRGSWAAKPSLRYSKRYKFNGDVNFGYSKNKIGSQGDADFSESNSFFFRWQHTQDPKANPDSRFNANVNIQSSNYKDFNPTNAIDRLSSSFNSSVTYSKSWAGNYNLTVGLRHSQNTSNKIVDVTLPDINFSVNRFYPFRKKKRSGKIKWYENVSMSYSTEGRNQYSDPDSLLFKGNWTERMRNGLSHRIPITSNVKVFKFFNWTNSVNLNDRMYLYKFDRNYVKMKAADGTDSIVLQTDTIRGFNNEVDFGFTSSLTTKVYGQINMKKGPIRAIRHVFTPSFGFNYTPDFSDPAYGYYQSLNNPTDQSRSEFYRFDDIFGRPPSMRSGSLSYSFSNNLEMKVRDGKDTITGTRKIKLIDNFTINGSYNLAADSLKWSRVSMSGRTTLFQNLSVTYSSIWDPYILDSAGARVNKLEWKVNKRLLRLDQTNWSIGFNYTLNNDTFKKKAFRNNKEEDEKDLDTDSALENFANSQTDVFGNQNGPSNLPSSSEFAIPWSLTFSYNLNYGVTHQFINYNPMPIKKVVQVLSFSGNLQLTPKWVCSFTSGWDFEQSNLSYTSVDIKRDLHCWEMKFNWVPIGPYKSWRFGINVKASILKDLKLEKKRDFRDRFENF